MKNGKKFRILSVIAVIVLSTVLLSFSASATGTSFNSAQSISFSSTIADKISYNGEEDYYKFTLNSSGEVTIDFTSYIKYYSIYIYDEAGKELWVRNKNEYNSTTGKRSDTYVVDLIKGTYYFKVDGSWYYGNTPTTGNYNFKMTFASANESFEEPNDSVLESKILSFNKTIKGQIATNDKEDYYKFTLNSSGEVTIDFTSYIKYYSIYIYDEAGKELWVRNKNEYNSTTSKRSDTYVVDLVKGTYYFKVDGSWYYGNTPTTGNYNFKMTFVSANESLEEPNDSVLESKNLNFNKTIKGQIAINDKEDYYSFSVKSTMKVRISFSAINLRYYSIYIYDSSGEEIWVTNKNEYDSTTLKRSDTYYVHLEKGTYYFKVDGSWYYGNTPTTGNYQFVVSDGKPGKTSKLTAIPKSNEIKLTWKAVSGADGYRVYQYDYAKKKSDRLATITGTSYTIKNLKANTKYRFSVKAYSLIDGEKVWSDSYTIIETQTCPGVTNKITAVSTTTTIKLTWNKVSGATGYRVYRYNATEKKWVTVVKETTKTTATIKFKTGAKTKFAVKSYKKLSDGTTLWSSSYKTIETATKTATPKISKLTSSSKGKAVIMWTNVSGENGFQVYYSTKKNGDFKKYSNYKGNTTKATVSKLKSGKTYYFKVRTYKTTDSGYVYSSWSSVKGVKIK